MGNSLNEKDNIYVFTQMLLITFLGMDDNDDDVMLMVISFLSMI